ncbi:MAG: glycoside hydrolase family protein [Sedimentisphaerales bacterium]|nr:glycoside hydrolase family protein [Sedimentisphaerales bacterium]
MIRRRTFIANLAAAPMLRYLSAASVSGDSTEKKESFSESQISDFCKRLKPAGRILEMKDWYVWGTSPINGPDGKVHVFFSRWPASRRMGGWINRSEIAHAVADKAEGPYENIETILSPRGEGFWDATTCHNPHIQKIDGKYCLFYMGNSNGKTNTKRVGLATADSLSGPWQRRDKPLIEPGGEDMWDNHCTSNPSFVKHPNGRFWLYYKSWNSSDYYNSADPAIRGNRKYGLAIADSLEGPYIKFKGNPVIDYSGLGDNRQIEDAYVFIEDGKFKMVSRDMGIFNHEVGLYLESDDGIKWSQPKIAYHQVSKYVEQPPAPGHLTKYGRFERPQILIRDGKPVYLFTASQGGQYMNASAFVFKISAD